ncbi:MAG: ABC transporter substrate-binding protein [Candidatus Eisenbacteria bacterium]|uniref:ABC transporter substrate-binding protein n=1 Tax=Eiseniibacteriota bacterium TaxID=2212470 RepID=A0A9D6LD32_UNCEI|nr:ABC transporter substrate-binding protein [Candidatus Eisenbacteria bacterium]MBI3540494.1 ABC transporter substrate-binding protein [Candidatus Eisenbacteria bacterium]
MSSRVRWTVLTALAGALLAGTWGCGAGTGASGSAYQDPHALPADTLTMPMDEVGTYGGRFVMAETAPPRTFNSAMANESSSYDVTDGRLYTTLVDYDNASQRSVPGLARAWEISPDGLTSTWHLRRGAAFTDGHPITSADVLFSFEIYMDDTLHVALYDFLKVKGRKLEVSAPDSYTVVIKVSAPYAMLEDVVSSVYIHPKHVLEPYYRSGRLASAYSVSTPPESLVTSGPWKLKQYVPNEKTVLTRNPYWYGVDAHGHRLPYLDELVFLIVPDQNTAALKFDAGEVDALDDVKPENYARYEKGQKAGNFTFYDLGPALNTNFFWFNLNRVREAKPGKKIGQPYVDATHYAWFSNRDFRRAVSKAIDRDAMIKSVFYGFAVKNWSTLTAGNKVWYTPDVHHDDYDLEGAKKLIAGLGWKDTNGDGYVEDAQGHTVAFTIKTNSSNLMRVGMCNFIKDDLKKIGIRVDSTPLDFNSLITNLRSDFQYEALLLGLQSAVPPDPGMGQNVWRSTGLTHYWNVKQPKPETPAEARVDSLVAANVGTLDMSERHRTWTAMQNTINDECFVMWLPTLVYKTPIRNRFGNVHPTVIPHRIIWNIDRVFVKSKARA